MQERPEPIERLDSLFRASRIAHEAIFDLHRELISLGRGTSESAELLEESARLNLRRLPSLAAEFRRLAALWEEQSVLDPDAAESTLRDLVTEFERIEPQAQGVVERQRGIATALRSMIES